MQRRTPSISEISAAALSASMLRAKQRTSISGVAFDLPFRSDCCGAVLASSPNFRNEAAESASKPHDGRDVTSTSVLREGCRLPLLLFTELKYFVSETGRLHTSLWIVVKHCLPPRTSAIESVQRNKLQALPLASTCRNDQCLQLLLSPCTQAVFQIHSFAQNRLAHKL